MRNTKILSKQKWSWIVIITMIAFSITFVFGHDKKTKRGNDIEHVHYHEFNEEQMKAVLEHKRQLEEEFGEQIQQVAGPTTRFNCFGLVFCNSTSWVTKLGTLEALFDEGYHGLNQNQDPQVGDLVLYFEEITIAGKTYKQLAHVGIIHGIDPNTKKIKVRSKWGANGEFIHDIDAVPNIYGDPVVVTTR